MDEDILFPNKKEGGAKAKKAYLPDWKALRDHLSKEGKISKESWHQLLNDTLNMLSKYHAIYAPLLRVRRVRPRFGARPATAGARGCNSSVRAAISIFMR
jgi:hypothetical protein